MAKTKYYAVRKGRNPGIYRTWDECKEQVDGFSGAEYKSFTNPADADAYMGNTADATADAGTTGTDVLSESDIRAVQSLNEGKAVAYVDGSFDEKTGKYGFAAVILTRDAAEPVKINGSGDAEDLASMRNVAGEINGARAAIAWALENRVKALEIHHDYTGVACWPDGAWKANLKGTKEYASYVRTARQFLEITFVKVKGHSGDTYNDMADLLAKQAIGLA